MHSFFPQTHLQKHWNSPRMLQDFKCQTDSLTSNEHSTVNATQEELEDDAASVTAIIAILIKEIHLWRKLMTLENKLNAWTLACMKGDIKK